MKHVAPACALALCALASPAHAQDAAHLTLKCPGSTVMVDGQGQASCPPAAPPAPAATPAPAVDSAEDAAMKRRLGHDFTFATPVADTTTPGGDARCRHGSDQDR
ncbi:hypothetical protein RI056_06465 [Komagataeibacter nataicola]|uniref:hypothetical protein n=1 Tax=Komagataeibacter nataicola TaxID=265960 RepID=UPI0028AD1C69|nr:hypothetical protein [Komagataeibacter nataicola]WNM09577.1 hypothetical protein RI056_06465 [Komagataeibacter nataicola]